MSVDGFNLSAPPHLTLELATQLGDFMEKIAKDVDAMREALQSFKVKAEKQLELEAAIYDIPDEPGE